MYTAEEIYDLGVNRNLSKAKAKMLAEAYSYLDEKYGLKDAVAQNKTIVISKKEIGYIQKKYCEGLKLSRNWYEYTCLLKPNKYIEFKEDIERKKKKEEQDKIDKEYEKELAKKYKELYKDKFRDRKWIENHIGEYYNWEDILSVYWTILDNEHAWMKVDWQGNIKIKEGYVDKLSALTKKSYVFRRFKNKAGYSCGIEGEYKHLSAADSFGIYGIYKNGSLLYVGMTMRDFELRWNEHKEKIQMGSKELKFYSMIKPEDDIEFVRLIDVARLNANITLTERDVKSMELATIALLEPEGNLAGRVCEYKY